MAQELIDLVEQFCIYQCKQRDRVLVRARDANEDPVAGVELEFTGTGLSDATGITDAQGTFQTTFTAPSVPASQRNSTRTCSGCSSSLCRRHPRRRR